MRSILLRCTSWSRIDRKRRVVSPRAAGGDAPPTPPPATQQQPQQQQYLYEPKYGLPVVRRKMTYSQLLRAVREEQVNEIHFFTTRGRLHLEGPCLVSLRDGSTAQAIVPADDARLAYAMETHNVRGHRLPAVPTVAELTPPRPMAAEVSAFLTNVLPYLAVVAVYLATSYVKWKKGDAEDRVKIKKREAEEKKRKEEEDRADRFLQDAEVLAAQGWTVDAILEKTAKAGINLDREQVQAVVAKVTSEPDTRGPGYNADAEQQLADEAAFREKMREAAAESDPNAQAEEFRRMKSVKIQKAQ